MQQYDDKLFQEILTRARRNLLNNDNIIILNSKVVIMILILNLDKHIVII